MPTEQLAQGFAIFSRNLSDLQRNTGPFLDFIRRFAPALEAQFRAATSTSEAFGVLTDAVNSLGDGQDRVRLLTAAGAEQFARLASAMRQGRGAIEEQARAYEGHSDAAIKSAQEIERRWNDMLRNLRNAAVRTAVEVVTAFGGAGEIARVNTEIERVRALIAATRLDLANANDNREDALLRFFGFAPPSTSRLLQDIRSLTTQLDGLLARRRELQRPFIGSFQTDVTVGEAPRPTALTPDQIKAAQDALALFMARLNQLPSQMDFVSEALSEQAWAKMEAAMAASGASEAQRAAARIGLIQQEAAARTTALGNAALVTEAMARREAELHQARLNGLITETEHIRALNLARSEAALAQMQELQGLGVTLTAQEQYEMTLTRINNALERGAITAQQAGRAQQAAAFAAQAAWAAALGNIAQNLSQAFGKNKAIATASAIISTYEAVNKSLAAYGATPLGFAAAAAALAAGIANVRAINSTTETSKSVSGGSGGGGVTEPAQQAPSQAVTISIAPGVYRMTHDELAALIEG